MKNVLVLQQAKLERLLRLYRDMKISHLQNEQAKVKRHRQLSQPRPPADQEPRRAQEEGRDMDPRTEEYEREAQQMMLSMRVDTGQVETTEKLIFELSQVLQQFSLKVAEQESVSIVSKLN